MIIGLYSPAPQSGKTTASEYIQTRYNYERISFASPLKSMLETLLGYLDFPNKNAYLYGDCKEVHIPVLDATGRHLMQTLGTEWGRMAVDPNLWVRVLDHRIRNRPQQNFIIDDMRFPNEAHYIRDTGGVIIKIVRSYKNAHKHASEGSLDALPFDFTVDNTTTLTSLYCQLDEILENI